MAIARLIPSTYAVSSTYVVVTNGDNALTNTDSTTYGTFKHNRASTSAYQVYLRGFNFNAIPSNAVVNSFTVKIKAYADGHITASTNTYKMSLANDTTVLDSTYASGRLSTTLTTFTFSNGALTWNDIVGYGSDFGIRIPLRRGSSSTAEYAYIYGAEIEVNYTAGTFVNIGDEMQDANALYKKTSGSWSQVLFTTVYKKLNGSWQTGQTSEGLSSMFIKREYILSNCAVNLDGIDSYANKSADESGDLFPFGVANNYMREYNVVTDGKSFEFNGENAYMRPTSSGVFDNYLYSTHTIEAFFELHSIQEDASFTLFVGRNSKQTIAIYCHYTDGVMTFIKSSSVASRTLVVPALSLDEKHYIAANSNGWMLDGTYYLDSESTAATNSVATNNMAIVGSYAAASIGMRFNSNTNSAAFNGKLYALRIHTDKLSEGEMRRNMLCDTERF